MERNNVINTLNKFLKGQYMGIHAYEHHIQKLKDPYIKGEFQKIQQDHKNHALKVAERIQNLGGTSKNNPGWGTKHYVEFQDIRDINVTVVNIGPYGLDAHKKLDRMDMKYSLEIVPNITNLVIKNLLTKRRITSVTSR